MPSATENSGPGPFIITTSLAKPDPKTRKLIRSHVMRGKNAGKFRPKSHCDDFEGDLQRKVRHAEPEAEGRMAQLQRVPGNAAENGGWTLVTPRKIASELLLFGFSSDMQPYVLGLVYRAFTILKPATYGMQDMTTAVHDDKLFCFANLTHHPGILHSTVFAAQAFHDMALGHPYSNIARLHLGKALGHLQRSLDDREKAVELSTMAVVASLATAAIISRDFDTATKHMDGLQRMVELRGGLQCLGPGSMIEHKARSIDIGLAMGLGQPLRFARDEDICWSPQIAGGRSAAHFPELSAAIALHQRPDPRLLNVWADLREFSRLVNEATARGTKVPMEIVTRVATSVPHRLLRLKSADADDGNASLHEMLRVCLLAYAKMLLIKLSGIGKNMTVLAEALKGVLSAWHCNLQLVAASEDGVGDTSGAWKLLLWGVFVASVSVFEDYTEPWLNRVLVQCLDTLGLRNWTETRDALKELLWIEVVFDKAGERLFWQHCVF